MTARTDEWDHVGFVISSRYRVTVVEALSDGAALPSQIARDAGVQIEHVSRALGRLRERSLVTLLVPEDRKKGRLYGLTDDGRCVWEQIQTENIT